MKIGSHVSIAGGLLGAAKEAVSYGANTFMTYTGAPQNTRRLPLSRMKIPEGQAFIKEAGMEGFVVHAPYIINLASCKDSLFELAVSFLTEEIKRTETFGSKHIVLHPGSFTEKDLDYGIDRIVSGLNQVLEYDSDVIVCLETMAGKGSEVDRTFNELARIIDQVDNKGRLGVCFDTCHTHDAGYDVINDFEGVMEEFDREVGLDRLYVYHINGSLNERGKGKDRHANIGAGDDNPRGADKIGLDAIRRIAHSKYADGRYLILETPWTSDTTNLYKEEIEAIRKPF